MIPAPIRRRVFLVAAAAAALMGCGSDADSRPAKWSFISATITEPSCATVNCHSEVAKRASVDFHDRASGFNVMTVQGYADKTAPDNSPVVYLMRGIASKRMPPDAPLPEADIKLIIDWIAAGTPND
ncbi:MAG TPA: hypothetical protein VN903_24415 [Polyangia bacterium]|nr:hypothetical protein [Polyangia bacterium]